MMIMNFYRVLLYHDWAEAALPISVAVLPGEGLGGFNIKQNKITCQQVVTCHQNKGVIHIWML